MTMGSAQLSLTSSSSGLLPVLSGLHPSRHCREMIVQSSLSARTTCQHVPPLPPWGRGPVKDREILSHESLVNGEIEQPDSVERKPAASKGLRQAELIADFNRAHCALSSSG